VLVREFEKSGTKFAVVEECESLMPILDNTDRDESIDFLLKMLSNNFAKNVEVLIFDRLHFTHVFRTASEIGDFEKIENVLLSYDILLVLLIIDEHKISERIQNTMLQRDQKWSKYVREKGNDAEIESYYIQQQKTLLKLVWQTKLPYIIENATDGNYVRIAEDILKKING
jgi:hypothetical protein